MCLNFKPHLWASFLCAVIGSLGIGYSLSLLNLLENYINCWYLYLDQNKNQSYIETCKNATELSKNGEFEVYAFRWSAVSSAALFGGMLAVLTVPIMDRYGRLTAIRLSIVVALIGVVLQSIAFYVDSYISLLIGRLMIGSQMGIGVMSYPVYLSEIATESRKSAFAMCFGMFVNIGVLLCMAAGLEWTLGNVNNWQYMLMSPFLIFIIQLILSIFSVESPSWQRNFGRIEQAKNSERKLFGFEVFQSNVEILKIYHKEKFWNDYWKSIKECFLIKSVRSKIGICLVLRIFQMSSFIPLIIFYSLGLLQNTGLSSEIAGLGSVGIVLAGSFGTIIGTLIVKRISIRNVYLVSLFGSFLMMTGFFVVGFFTENGDYVRWIGLVFITLVNGFGNMGVMTIPFALPAIWIPIKYRAISMALMVISGLAVVFVWSILFPYLLIKIDNWTFLIFVTALSMNFLYGWWFVKLDK